MTAPSTPAGEEVLAEVLDGVLVLTLNRPEAMNAIDGRVADGLLRGVERLDADDSLAVGVLAANGRGFSAGLDLKAFLEHGLPPAMLRFLTRGSVKPLVAAVEGFALAGGLEVALTCDLVVSARDARFGIPETGVGLFAAGGALMRLPRRVPYGLAMELALTADPIDAARAHAAGLVDRLVEPGTAREAAIELARRIARNAPLAVAASKELLRATAGRKDEEFWEYQAPLLERIFGSEDAKEGPRAFAERRPPRWSGR